MGLLKKILSFLTVVVLVSCGGGGGGSSEPTPPPLPRASVNLSAEPLSVLNGNDTTLTWSTANATTCNASGAWSGSKATSGSEDVTITLTGDNQFTLTCTGPGGSGSDSVIVEGYENASGFVVDGYIVGADVFIDQDGNFISDNLDETTQSDSSGNFIIKKTSGDYVSIGGTDFDTQNPLDNLLLWHKTFQEFDPKAITPVTSVASFLADPTSINDMLGLATDINVFTFDPVANKGDDGPNDFLYEKGNQLTTIALTLQNSINEVNSAADTSENIFLSIANVLESNFAESNDIINIESFDFLDAVMTDLQNNQSINIGDESRNNVITALSSILPMIEVKSSETITNGIFSFATSTLQTDIILIANGSASEELINSYKTDILNYVAEDQNLDPADIVPEIIANDDNYFTDEDTAISFNILSNDSYQINSQIAINVGVPSNGSIESNQGLITYTPDENYFGQDEFSYTIEQAGFGDDALVNITVDSVNDLPEILSSTYQIDENTTEVGAIRATDADGQDLNYQIREGDSEALDLVGNNLSFKENTNYEDKSEYEFVASVSDGIAETQKNLKVFITDIDEPMVFTTEGTFAVDENTEAIGTVNVDDPDGRDITYSLQGGDKDFLVIGSTSGVLSFNDFIPNYEDKSSFVTLIVATDGISEITQDLVINIVDINEAPVFVTESEQFADEEESGNEIILTATDDDNDTLTYSISGPDAEKFTLDSASGLMQFKEIPDYEEQASYSLNADVTDGEIITRLSLSIKILNVNETPEITSPLQFNMDENTAAAGQVVAIDPENDELTYSLFKADASLMSIDAAGNILLTNAANYEVKDNYDIQVRVTDSLPFYTFYTHKTHLDFIVSASPFIVTFINIRQKYFYAKSFCFAHISIR